MKNSNKKQSLLMLLWRTIFEKILGNEASFKTCSEKIFLGEKFLNETAAYLEAERCINGLWETVNKKTTTATLSQNHLMQCWGPDSGFGRKPYNKRFHTSWHGTATLAHRTGWFRVYGRNGCSSHLGLLRSMIFPVPTKRTHAHTHTHSSNLS